MMSHMKMELVFNVLDPLSSEIGVMDEYHCTCTHGKLLATHVLIQT